MHHRINMFQLQNERSAGRKQPVMILCNHSSPCREVMKSCKLLQPIALGWLYLFRTGNEEWNQLRHYSLPTLGFFKICRFWYSSSMPSIYNLLCVDIHMFFLLQISLPACNTQRTLIQTPEKDLMALSVME